MAPAILTIMRFCQGLGLGGEWSSAALLASEYAEDGKRARAAMWPQLGAPTASLRERLHAAADQLGFLQLRNRRQEP